MSERFPLSQVLRYTIIALGCLLLSSGGLLISNRIPVELTRAVITFFIRLGLCEQSCRLSSALTAEVSIGGFVLITGISIVIFALFYKQIALFTSRHYPLIIKTLVCCLLILLLALSLFRYFAKDGFEHVHCAWKLTQGEVPYVDFFENHHPLLWAMILPFVKFYGQTLKLFIALRLFFFLLSASIVWLTYRLSRLVEQDSPTAWISIYLLLSMGIFTLQSIEIRPDVPQVLAQLLSIYFFLDFMRAPQLRKMFISGFWGGLAFLFLQKAISLLIAYGALFIYFYQRGRLNRKDAIYFVKGWLIPVMIFFFILWQRGMLADYWICAWIFNAYHFHFSPLISVGLPFRITDTSPAIRMMAHKNYLFWSLSLVAVIYVLRYRAASRSLKAATFLGLVLWLPFFVLRIPYGQYLLPAIPLLCIANAHVLNVFFERRRLTPWARIGVLLILGLPALIVYFRHLFIYPINQEQYQKIEYVLSHSSPKDYLYDGDIQFNIFRRDLHYFWYYLDETGTGRGLLIYNMITGNRFGDYDLCALIERYQPQFISDLGPHFTECPGIKSRYQKSPFRHIYRRVDNVSSPRASQYHE